MLFDGAWDATYLQKKRKSEFLLAIIFFVVPDITFWLGDIHVRSWKFFYSDSTAQFMRVCTGLVFLTDQLRGQLFHFGSAIAYDIWNGTASVFLRCGNGLEDCSVEDAEMFAIATTAGALFSQVCVKSFVRMHVVLSGHAKIFIGKIWNVIFLEVAGRFTSFLAEKLRMIKAVNGDTSTMKDPTQNLILPWVEKFNQGMKKSMELGMQSQTTFCLLKSFRIIRGTMT